MNDRAYSFLAGRVSGRIGRGFLSVLLVMLCGLVVMLTLSTALGSYHISLSDLGAILFTSSDQGAASTVVWQLRLPRFVSGCFVGALLAISGALLQGVTRNPLADPSLVGVSQGAGLAVVAMIVLWPELPVWMRPIGAFVGGMAAATLIQWIADGKRGAASLRFILVGIGVAALISAGTTAMLTYGQINRAMSALGWLAGSVHTATWGTCAMLAICSLLSLPFVIWSARPVAALRFGPEISTGFGVNVRQSRFSVVTIAVALAGFAVAAAGPIGFIGLLAPQLALRVARVGLGTHLILSAMVGALIVTAADLVGRTLATPLQIPAGVVSAIIGVPIFVILVLKRARFSQL